MANFYLDTNGISELGQSSSPVRVNGTAGDKDRILLLSNAANVTVGPAVEIIDFAGSVADYAFVQAAGGIAVYRGDTLVATLASNPSTSELRFAEGGLTLEQTAEGPFALGGQEVTAEKAAYTGNGMLTGQEHQSLVDGGDTPAGPGETYTLPRDLGTANLITSGTGNDTFNTDMNGLRPNAQIVDESTTDRDVLNLHYNTLNTNKQILNVETINAIWEGVSDGQFDAKQVSHAGDGTNIVLSTTKSTSKNFVVKDVKANTVTAGEGVTGTVEAQNVKGGTVDMGGASGLILTAPSGTVDVKASRDFTLDSDTAFTKSKPLTITSDEDITIKAGLKGGVQSESYIQAAGRGAIILDTGLDGDTGSGDISHMTGFKAIGVKAKDGAHATYIVSNDQTVLFTTEDDGTNTATFETDGKTGNLNVVLGLIAGERDLGQLDISGGGAGKNNMVTGLNIDVNDQDIVIENLIGDGGSGSLTEEPGTDVFTIFGSGNATIKDMDNGGTVDASGLDGKLVFAGKDSPHNVQAADKGVALAAGKAGSEVYIKQVDKGLFFLAGGEGVDTLTLSGTVKDSNELNKATVTAVLGGGDDVVILEKGFELESGSGSLSLDFGEGKDALKVAKDAGEIKLTDGSTSKGVSLVGFETMEIGKDASLKVNASSLGSGPAFELLSDGLTIVYDKKAGRNLDLSGIKGASEATKPVVKVDVTEGEIANGAVTLGDGLTEKVVIRSDRADPTDPIVLSNIVTLKNFTANGVDRFAFYDNNDGTKVSGKQNIKGDGSFYTNDDFIKAGLPAGATLVERLAFLVEKAVTDEGDYAFYSDGTDTYVLACGADSKPASIVRLEGANYTAASLTASMGFQNDDAAKNTLVTSVDGYKLAVDPVDTGTPFNFIVDKAGANKVTIQGGSGADTLVISADIDASGSVTTVSVDASGNTVNPGDMGAGADTVTIGAIEIASGGSVTINTGADADIVNLSAELDVKSGGTLNLDGGDDATLNITGATLAFTTAGAKVSIRNFDTINGSMELAGTEVLADKGAEHGFALNGSLKFTLGANDTVLDLGGVTNGGEAKITIDASANTKPAEITLSESKGDNTEVVETVKIAGISGDAAGTNAISITGFTAASGSDAWDVIDITATSLSDVTLITDSGNVSGGSLDLTDGGKTLSVQQWITSLVTGTKILETDKMAHSAADGDVAVALYDDDGTYLVFGTAATGVITGNYYVVKLAGIDDVSTLTTDNFAGADSFTAAV